MSVTTHGPLLRAAAELANAANAVRPLGREGYITIPVFAFGWPTGEAAPVVAGASMLDAAPPRPARRLQGPRGRIALALTAIVVGPARLHLPPQREVAAVLRGPAARRRSARTTTRSPRRERRRRRGGVLRTSWSRRQYVKKADIVRYGPHRANVADIWRRADLPRDGKAPVLLQVPGGAWAIGMRRPQAYPLMSHIAERGWVCVSMAYRVSPRNTWPAPHRRRQAGAGVGQGEHRRVRRRPGLRRDHRRLGRRAPDRAGRADPERAGVAAGLRGRRHLGGGRGADLRPLRLVHHRGRRPPRVHRDSCRSSSSRSRSRRTGRTTSTRRRSPRCAPTRRRSSSCTARTTRSSRSARAASSRGARGEVRRGRRLLRDPARAARVRLLRLAARPLHRDGGRRTSWTG